jgi:hypothetical protein
MQEHDEISSDHLATWALCFMVIGIRIVAASADSRPVFTHTKPITVSVALRGLSVACLSLLYYYIIWTSSEHNAPSSVVSVD